MGDEQSSDESLRFLVGGGEMGAAVRGFDWAATPVGAPGSWPQSLRAALGIMLRAHYPINVYWGPQLVNFYNDAYLPIIGVKHPDGLGRPLREVWPEVWPSIEPLLEAVLTDGETFYSEDVQQFVTRSGFTEEIYMSFSYGPIYDESGAVGGVFAAGTEVTGTVIGHRRLRLLRELGSASATATDVRSACQAMAAVLEGFREDVPFAAFCLPSDDGRWKPVAASGFGGDVRPPTLSAEVAEGEASADDLDVVFPSGPWEETPGRAAVSWLRPERAGEPVALLLCGFSARRPLDDAYRDFHALLVEQCGRALAGAQAIERAEARRRELEALDRAKNEFLATVSHEFRTPLTLVLGPLGDLLGEGTMEGSQRQIVATARDNALRLSRLVENLLTYARVQAGRMDATFVREDIGALATTCAALFRSAFEGAGLELAVETPDSAPVWVDRRLFEHVLFNLLSNALKFTRTGRVTVRVRDEARGVVLEVEDTGVGVPADALPRIFERFHRADSAGARSHEGAGIGLALVRQLVELHGGTVEVDSERGRGSTFRVVFRRGAEHLDPELCRDVAPDGPGLGTAYLAEASRWADEAVGAGAGRGAVRRHRILVVDDHPGMRDYLRRILEPSFAVVLAADADAALASLDDGVPDCVVCDIMLPGTDGIALLRQLRERDDTRYVPVVLVSARADEATRLEGLEAGADDFLVKPFSARELQARVRNQVDSVIESARRERGLRLAAESAERAKSAFLANMSHEIRTPLSNITLAAAAASRLSGDGSAASYLGRIEGNVRRLGEMLDSILTLARLEAGAAVQRPEPVDVVPVVRELAEAWRLRVRRGGLSLTVEVDPAAEGVAVAIDRGALASVLQNLLSNAAKFTHEGGITVRVDADDAVRIHVVDTGVGIAEDFLPSLFRMFSQEEAGWRRPFEGSGVGLALTQRLVQISGGRIEVESRKGNGTRFTVSFPTTTRAAVAEPASGGPVDGSQRARVLLVEDQQDARELLSELLSEVAEVSAVGSGERALEVATGGAFDVLLLDVNLDGRLTGVDVMKRLRSTPRYARCPMVVLTAYALPGDEERLLAEGFDAYVAKPFDIDELLGLVTRLAARDPG